MQRRTATTAILGVIAFVGTSAMSVTATGSNVGGPRELMPYHRGTPSAQPNAATSGSCYDQIYGDPDSGLAASSQAMPDLGITTMAADNFRCYGSHPTLKHVTVLGWYYNCPGSACLPPDSFNVTVWPNDPDDTKDEPADREGPPICSVNTKNYTVTPPDSNPTEHTFVLDLPTPYCAFPSHKWLWLEVQAVMDVGSHGQWGWSLNQGVVHKYDADWKNPDSRVVIKCATYDDNGKDLEGCIFGGENGTPDLLFSVN